jgi:hypothetical protein
LYSWGKLKVSGDNIMFPMADQNMTGAWVGSGCARLSSYLCCGIALLIHRRGDAAT